MRVTNQSLYRTVNSDLLNLVYQQVSLQKDISTGHKVNKPSEAEGQAITILRSTHSIGQVDQYRVNLESANNWLNASEDSMQSIVDLLSRASTLAEQMSSGTYTKLDQQAAAAEVDNLISQITNLGNTQVEGRYIFGGSVSESPPVNETLLPEGLIALTSDAPQGHDLTASAYFNGVDYQLRLARAATGATATLTVPADAPTNNLGAGLGLNLDAWTQDQAAGTTTGDIYSSTQTFAGTASLVSNRMGEVLNFTGDADAGTQTYRTRATVTFSGAAGAGLTQVSVGADTYTVVGASAAASAADLVEQVNADPARAYFAWTDGSGEVSLMSKSAATFALAETSDTGGVMAVDGDTTLAEIAADLNAGLAAAGTVHLDDAALPAGADTITLGADTWTWSEIIAGVAPAPGTAAEYANALANWLGGRRDDVSAGVSTSGTGATVQITSRALGSEGNLTLTSSNALVGVSGGLMGGLDGSQTDTDGSLYASGTSSLRLATTVRCQVLDNSGGTVDLRLRWYDDSGAAQSYDLSLPATGDTNAVAVPGLGGISIYRDGGDFQTGATFELKLGHYTGNTEDLNVMFSVDTQMRYNWNARQILGDSARVDLWDENASTSPTNTGSGGVHMNGAYSGLFSRQYNFEVLDGGQVPGNDVTLRVRWADNDGVAQVGQVTLSGAGRDNAVTLPDGEGASIYLDNGTYSAGDSFAYQVEKDPLSVMDTLREWSYQLNNGTAEEGQTASQRTLEGLDKAVSVLLDYVADAGARQTRIEVRQGVMDSQELAAVETLEDLRDVDVTEAFLTLRMVATAYNSALKVTSTVTQLSLLDEL